MKNVNTKLTYTHVIEIVTKSIVGWGGGGGAREATLR